MRGIGQERSASRMVGWIVALSLGATGLITLAPGAQSAAAADPRPIPPPLTIAITPDGYVPDVVTAVAGQVIRFLNESGAHHTVTDLDDAFDSGPIAPGGAFALVVGAPGDFSFGSADDASFSGLLTVGLLDLPGDATTPVGGNLPLLRLPLMADMDEHPMGIVASRSRVVVGLEANATFAEVNTAFADAGVTLVGTIPSLDVAVVQVAPLPAAGDFAPLEAAIASLDTAPAVRAAAMDKLVDADAIVKPTDASGPADWVWNDPRGLNYGPGQGDGGNWGLESGRFPSAWNVLDTVRHRNPGVDTVVYDVGFDLAHPELNHATPVALCSSVAHCSAGAGTVTTHGTHVAGIIGAKFDNPGQPPESRTLGISGGNPEARLSVVSMAGTFEPGRLGIGDGSTYEGATSSAANWAMWGAMLDEARPGGRWPDLRVINMSARSVKLSTTSTGVPRWGAIHDGLKCGPGYGDDTADRSVPCTPNTLDRFLNDVAKDGELVRTIAEKASTKGVLLVISAGNDSGAVCDNAVTTKSPIADMQTPPNLSCPASFEPTLLDNRRTRAFGWASNQWTSAAANPILNVEAIDRDRTRAPISHVGGNVSAPGVDVRSLNPVSPPPGTPVEPANYALKTGTSMAAPHVAALAGWLAAVRPEISVGELRAAIVDGARFDTQGINAEIVAPRIDAYASLLRVAGSLPMLADLSDHTADGNRRIVRAADGTQTVDITMGGGAFGKATHSQPDGKVDMRDFRRFRDAQLQICSYVGDDVAGCPLAPSIRLDGSADHPKKDLNFDGCVTGAAGCIGEENWSRFDLNGDGVLAPMHQELVTVEGSVLAATDLDLLRRVFASSEGWEASRLPELMRSGDLEIHADPLFLAGVDKVDVEIHYGAERTVGPAREIRRGSRAIVATVPTTDAGQPVEVVGRVTLPSGEVIESATETLTLHHGEDVRVDLCIPHVEATVDDAGLFADGQDTARVHAQLVFCSDAEAAEIEGRSVRFGLELEQDLVPFAPLGAPEVAEPDSTLSDTHVDTDASGRASVTLQAGDEPENLVVVAEISIETPAQEPLVLTDAVAVEVTHEPRLIYRLEQTTSSWEVERHSEVVRVGDTLSQVTDVATSTAPVVLERKGSVTPIEGDATTRSGARVTETVSAGDIAYQNEWYDETLGEGGTYQRRILVPTSQRTKTDVRVGDLFVDFRGPSGAPNEEALLADTYFELSDDYVHVHKLDDLSALHYLYDEDPNNPCNPTTINPCGDGSLFEPVAYTEREDGSAFAYGPDLDAPITFSRLPDGSWSTYRWCPQPEQFDFPPRDALDGFFQRGTATSQFRFVATITSDPTATPDDLTFPSNCTDPQPPVAAIDTDLSRAQESRVMRFVDASTDPNGDIVAWRWNFGDGTTSTEQNPDHRFLDDGIYAVSLVVTDELGASSVATFDVRIDNVAPTIDASDVITDEGEGAIVELVAYDPGERDQETLRASFEWSTPDLPTMADQYVAAGSSYFELGVLPAGEYTLTITIADKDDAEASKQISVRVRELGAEPEVGVESDDEPDGTVDPDEEIESEPAAGCDFGVKLSLAELDVVELTSRYRLDNGRSILQPSPTLAEAALAHAEWLRDNDRFQHEGPGGNSPTDRAAAAGYPSEAVGENLARGYTTATSVVTGWKVSDTHNANLLHKDWRAIGVARVATERGWLWVQVFGDRLDCPSEPPDLEEPTDPGLPEIVPPTGVPGETLGWKAIHEPAVVPITAITIDDLTPATGEPVRIVNRSSSGVVILAGDGTPARALASGSSTDLVYYDPGTYIASASAAGRSVSLELLVGGAGRPPVVESQTAPGAAFGAEITLRALVLTPDGAAVRNRPVEFDLGGHTVAAVTDDTGIAAAPLEVDFGPGTFSIVVRVPALAGGTSASDTDDFVVTANSLPVADAGGPYDALVDGPVNVDFSGSFDPDGSPLANIELDLDLDGEFDDGFADPQGLSQQITSERARDVLCGGACDPSRVEEFAIRITDDAGARAIDTAEVSFRRDFSLSVTPGNLVVQPGGSVSFLVAVVSESGYADAVDLSVVGLPDGVTATFEPDRVTPNGHSFLTLSAASDAAAFDGPVVVRGSSGAIVHDANSTVQVEFGLVPLCTGAADFRVVDDMTGDPIAGASVSAGGLIVATDEEGRARLAGLPLGAQNAPVAHFIQAMSTGYWPSPALRTVVACDRVTPEQTIRIVPIERATLTGRVVVGIPDPRNTSETRAVTPGDEPIPGAAMTINSGEGTRSAIAESDGTFIFDDVAMSTGTNAPLAVNLRAAANGYTNERYDLVLASGNQHDQVVALVPKCFGSADIRVLDPTGKPVVGALVGLTWEDGSATELTGGDGRARLSGIALGPRQSAVSRFGSAVLDVDGQRSTAGLSVVIPRCGGVGATDAVLSVPTVTRGSVRGAVTDQDTGEPLAGVRVSGPGGIRTTDADGRYAFDNVEISATGATLVTMTIEGSTAGYFTTNRYVVLRAGATVVHDFAMLRQKTGSIEGTVIDAVTGQPLFGARITNTVSSAADGSFRLDEIPLGPDNTPAPWTVGASLTGFWNNSVTTTVGRDVPARVTIALARECAPSTISGRVFDAATGQVLADALVSWGNNDNQRVFTNALGVFTLSGIHIPNNRPWDVVVTAQKFGFNTQSRTVTVFCGASIRLDFGGTRVGSATVTGTVTSAISGLPVAGATVGGSWGVSTTTATNGSYSFVDVPVETATGTDWEISVRAPNRSGLSNGLASVTVTAGASVQRDFVLAADVNAAPVANDRQLFVGLNQSFVDVTLTATDPDADSLTFRVLAPSAGTFLGTVNGDRVRFSIPTNLQQGTFQFVASDGRRDSNVATVTVDRVSNLPPVLDPTVFPTSRLVNEGGFGGINLNPTDPDGFISHCAWSIDGGPFEPGNCSHQYHPLDDPGTQTVIGRAIDTNGAFTDTAPIVFTAVNVAPNFIFSGPWAANEDEEFVDWFFQFTDPGVEDTWTGVVDWGDGTAAESFEAIGYQSLPAHTYVDDGTFTITIVVCDDDGGCTTETTTVVVAPGPTLTDVSVTKTHVGSFVRGEIGEYTITVANGGPDAAEEVTIYDYQPDGLTFVDADAPGWTCESFTWGASCVRAEPLPASSSDSIKLRFAVALDAPDLVVNGVEVYDYWFNETNYRNNYVEDDTAIVDGGTNDPPVVGLIGDVGLVEGSSVDVEVSASDPDGDVVVLSLVGAPVWVSLVDHGDGTATVTLEPPNDGDVSVTVRACDGSDACSQRSFGVTVDNVAPVGDAGGPYSRPWGVPVALVGSGSDPADGLMFRWDVDGDGTFDTPSSASAATIAVYSDPGFVSPVLEACDDDVCVTVVGSVTVGRRTTSLVYDGSVSGQYSDPLSVGATLTDTTVLGPVAGAEIGFALSGASLEVATNAAGRAQGSVLIDAAAGTVDGAALFAGSDRYDPAAAEFDVAVSREDGELTYVGDVTVVAGGVRLAARFVDAADGSVGDRRRAFAEWLIHSGAACTGVSQVVGPVAFDAAGEASTVVELEGAGDGCVRLRLVSDHFTAEFVDTVLAGNDPPVVGLIGDVGLVEGSSVDVEVSASDPDGDVVVLSLVGAPVWVSLVDHGDGTATVTLEPPNDGDVSVTVRACDPLLQCHDASFSVRVDNVAPTIETDSPVSIPWGESVTLGATGADPADDLTFQWDLDGDGTFDTPISDSSAASTSYPDPGIVIAKVRVCDDDTCVETTAEINVTSHPTELVYVGATSGQYSDPTALSATLIDGLSDLPVVGAVVGFELGSSNVSGTTNELGRASAALTVSIPAGSTNVRASYAGNARFGASTSASVPFAVRREDATVTYTGDTIVAGTAARLAARFVEAGDGSVGLPIGRAAVTFDVYAGALNCGSGTPTRLGPIPVVDTGTIGDGIGAAEITMQTPVEQSYCIVTRLTSTTSPTAANAWYDALSGEIAVLTVYSAYDKFATAGGWIVDDDTQSRGNFGFTVRFTKSGAPKGQAVYVWRGVLDGQPVNYILKSNSLTRLSFSDASGNGSFPWRAVLEGKATMKVVRVRDGVELLSDGNVTFTIVAIDSGASSGIGRDSYAIRAIGKQGVVLKDVGVWTGAVNTSGVLLGGGNVVVHLK